MTIIWLGIFALACARTTRLIRADEITKRFRLWWVRKFGEGSLRTYMIFCAWCISFWLAPIFAAGFLIYVSSEEWWLIAPLSLAFSYITGLLARLEGD